MRLLMRWGVEGLGHCWGWLLAGVDEVDHLVNSVFPEAGLLDMLSASTGHGEGLFWIGELMIDGFSCGGDVGAGPIEKFGRGVRGVLGHGAVEVVPNKKSIVGDNARSAGHGLHDAFGVGVDELGWAPGKPDAGLGIGVGALGVVDFTCVVDGSGAFGDPFFGAKDADLEALEGADGLDSSETIDDGDDEIPEEFLGVPFSGDDAS